MGNKKTFLADFHVHTNLSDGRMKMREVIDLYGQRGFGAIAITDHIAENHSLIGMAAQLLDQVLTPEKFANYMEMLAVEADRAMTLYGMVVIPGFELSKNTICNQRSAHILGIGISKFISADGSPQELSDAIRAQGGVSVAAHPVNSRKLEKQTYYLWDRRSELADTFDAWEVASGTLLFPEVAETKLPKIASSDLHMPKHLESWKTELHCELKIDAILDKIRKQEIEFKYYKAA